MATTIIETPTNIPDNFGEAGRNSSPSGGQGTPSLRDILRELQDATVALDAAAGSALGAGSMADLASVANGKGASLVGIEDAGSLYAALTVEAALAEVRGVANAAVPLASVQLTSTAALVAGDRTISTGVTITAGSIITPLRVTPDATAANWGDLTITNKVVGGPGVGGFHIHSANASDTSHVAALIIG